MARIGVFLLLVVSAAVVAGLFGAMHNQISYTVGPDYFTQFKFPQYGIPPETPPRIGAALVGWRVGWWLGVIAGSPPFLLGLIILPAPGAFWSAGLRAILAVVLTAALMSGVGWVFGIVAVDANMAAQVPLPDHITDPVGFLRAGVMHDASHVGGFIGVLVAIWMIFRASRPGAR